MSNGVRYTRDRLTEAAAQCSSIDEVITFFGTQPYCHLRRYLTRRFAYYGIAISHFAPSGRHPRPSAEDLRLAAAESVSIAGLLRRLGHPDSGTQRALLQQWLAEERISTAHFLGQAHQRGGAGTTPLKRAEDILVKHDSKRRTKTVLLRRALREVGTAEQCAECGTGPEWLGKPMTLEVDHINGDWSDDRPANLRLLCPNCHASTDTWCRGGRSRQVAGDR
ncbi:HNH endonuclease signature motif containing protein [Streptomyces sp. E5N91]|uniref:HNH endonuclease signature motif containing protein n=1 Tax=Streptomyces sp. E5N91 TaxID=1851996 RepID=UPI000EF63087|nr:HNH endonuclease signature motif containing protein [Streptomyces sp. E5N91]